MGRGADSRERCEYAHRAAIANSDSNERGCSRIRRFMSETNKITRVPSLKTVQDFRQHVTALGINLPCEDAIIAGRASPLLQPIPQVTVNGKKIGNRWAVQPMEGWDGTTSGGVTAEVRPALAAFWRERREDDLRRRSDGGARGRSRESEPVHHRARERKRTSTKLRDILVDAHQERFGKTDDLVIGFQLTHSGRFCKPTDKKRMEPRVAYRHPILDRKFKVTSDAQIVHRRAHRDVDQAICGRGANRVECGRGLRGHQALPRLPAARVLERVHAARASTADHSRIAREFCARL